MPTRLLVRRSPGWWAAFSLTLALLLAAAGLTVSGDGTQARVDITLHARNYEFDPPRIAVALGDIVRITLIAEEIPHSFTIDAYRISKRAAPGRPVTFEFRAEAAGTFPYYCELNTDDGCRRMRGELVVTER